MAVENGTWGALSIEPPDFLKDVREGATSVSDYLLGVLDVLRATLDVAKAFSVGSIDPINTLIEELLGEIQALLESLGDLGIYMAGDRNLLTPPFEELRGGYQGYERRMIARLTDRTDPSRPDIGSKTKVFGAFFYQNADATGIESLVGYVQSLLSFFRQEKAAAVGAPTLPTPIPGDVTYGIESLGLLSWKALPQVLSLNPNPPTTARIDWKVQPSSEGLTLPPRGFLVTVSTLPEGIPLVYDRPKANAVKGQEQPREYGPVLATTGKPIVLYGGADHLDLAPEMAFNVGVGEGGKRKDGKVRIYGMGDTASNAPIPLELLKDGATYYLQRSFWVDTSTTYAQWALDSYSIELDKSEMPNKALFRKAADGTFTVEDLGKADTYYVRIATVSGSIIDRQQLVYDFKDAETRKDAAGNLFIVNLKDGAKDGADCGEYSEPVEVVFPTKHTSKYLRALETALAVVALARVDLPVVAEQDQLSDAQKTLIQSGTNFILNMGAIPTGLEAYRDLLPKLLGDASQTYAKSEQNPLVFRRELRERIRQTALELYRASGPSKELEKFLVAQTETLVATTWEELLQAHSDPRVKQMAAFFNGSGLTILGALEDHDGDQGIAPNPWSMGVRSEQIDRCLTSSGVLLARAPGFLESQETPQIALAAGSSVESAGQKKLRMSGGDLSQIEPLKYYTGSADRSPVLYVGRELLSDAVLTPGVSQGVKTEGAMAYCRSLFLTSEQVLVEAAQILNFASAAGTRSSRDGAWSSVRFLDWMPDLGKGIALLENWLGGIGTAGLTIGDSIQQYLNFLDARISDTQQLVLRINALLQSLVPSNLPKTAGLLLLSDGTDGLLSDFVTAENKPHDSAFAYGAGMVLVGTTVPAFLVDIFNLEEGFASLGEDVAKTTFSVVSQVLPVEEAPADPDEEEPTVL